MSDWQLIETAPRTGCVILLARQKPHGEWDIVAATFVAEETYQWVFLEDHGTLNGYMDDLTGPTHWAPMPAPPAI
jgi:hypothetical protein